MLNKGLWVDGDNRFVPPGFWSDARNAVIYNESGDYNLSNEKGYSTFANLPTDFTPIGKINFSDGNTILFLSYIGYNNAITPKSKIVLVDKFGNLTTILSSDILNFNSLYQIKGTYYINSKNERNIYWTDGYNTPSYLNIDNFDVGTITQEDLSLFYLVTWPKVSLGSVLDTGGQLEAGSYQATIQVLNSDFQPSNYLFVSDPISITNKLQSEAQVASNTSPADDQYDGAQSGFPTTKSIIFNISELSGDIKYYNLIIIQNINGVKSYFQTPTIPLPSDLSNTTYTLSNTSTLTPALIGDITGTQSTYSTARTINQLNNTLLLGGLSQNIDLQYQELANQIQVYYYREEFNLDDDTQNYKSALNNTTGSLNSINNNAKGFQSDEVYALAIVWHFDDGNNSYAYHIPGRAKIIGRDNLTVTDTIYGVGTPIWKAQNTADTEAIAGNTNLLAYWESTELYPNTSEWGSLAGTPVRHHKMPSLGKSSHYKVFVDGSNNVTERVGRILRLNITNIQLPTILQNKIVGYSIVRVQRNESNKSILMQGGLFNMTFAHASTGANHIVVNSFPFSGRSDVTGLFIGNSTGSYDIQNEFSFYSPEDRFNTVSQVIPDYIQNEYVAYATEDNNNVEVYVGYTNDETERAFNPGKVNDNWMGSVGQRNPSTNNGIQAIYAHTIDEGSTSKKRAINTIKEIAANNSTPVLTSSTGVYINNDGGPSFLAVDTSAVSLTGANAPLKYPEQLLFDDGVTSWGDTTTQCTLKCLPLHGYNLADAPFEPGDGVITAVTGSNNRCAYYISTLRKSYFAQYETLDTLTYMYAGTTVFLPTEDSKISYDPSSSVLDSQGDTFISNFYFRRTIQGDKNTFNGATVNSSLLTSQKAQVRAMNYIPVESTVNVDLRNSGADMNPPNLTLPASYYPKTGIYSGTGADFLETSSNVDNFYAYNIDYSTENTIKGYFPKPINAVNTNLFANRIIYSNRKGDEDIFDAYRQFLINNYKDMPRDKGIIKDIWIDHNRVYIHMENTLYVIPTDELKFGTTEGTVNVGTGAFLEQTPIELKSSEDGYLGLPTAFANILTPQGYFSIDTRRCEAFLFTGEDTKISELGMRSFFLNNASLSVVDQVNSLDPNSGIIGENGYSPNGIGYSVAYDAKYRRIIIYKKDYTLNLPNTYNPTFPTTINSTIVNNLPYFFSGGYFYLWELIDGTHGPLSTSIMVYDTGTSSTRTIYLNLLVLDNTTYFTDNSFTLSYSMDTKSWTSFHDYQPMFMYNSLNFFSVPYIAPGNANAIKEHHTNNYGLFQSLKPFIVEATLNRIGNYGQFNSKSNGSPYVENALITDSTQGHKQTQSFILDTKCIDSNGVLQIATFDNMVAYNSYQSTGLVPIVNRHNASYVRGIWNINRFRDLVNDYTIPFFDSKKNPTNINVNKPYTLQKRLTDNYVVTRFIFNNTNNFKLSLYDITHIFRKVLR